VWFVYLATALVLLVVTGIYARRRLAGALRLLGAGDRAVRVVRWLVAWLLWGFPVLMIGSVLISRLVGGTSLPRFDGLVASWLLVVPFAWAMLVVFQAVPWLVAIDIAYAFTRRRPRAPRLRALGVLAALGVFALYTPLRIAVERGDMRVREHHVGSGAGPRFRFAFLADVQQDAHTDAARAKEVYALVNARHPELVLSGGDWINMGPRFIESAAAAAAELHSPFGTFSVRGDHEYFAYFDRERSVAEVERAMREHGVTMLANDVRWFQHAGKRIGVVFLDNNYIHHVDPVRVLALVAAIAPADYKIVVTHQLHESLAALLENRVDLVLAGHTHGGQVNPVVGVTHVNLARLETPYVDGRYQRGKTTIIVTAGIGFSIVPFRYAAPGSVEIIDVAL
jgi:predicted MPP superfamily phosphohydrolase